MKFITAFFVHRPLLVRLIMLFILIAGGLALRFQTYEMFPTIDLGIVTVTTYRPGSSPEDVELSLTIPLEEELLEVDGLEKVYSSSMESMSVITIRMDPDADDPKQILADIQKAVDRGAAELPSDLLQTPLVEELSTRTIPVIEIHVTGDVPEKLLRQTAKQLAQQNVQAIAKSNVNTVITTCPGCARALREDYPALGIPLPKKVRVYHITEFLSRYQKKLAPILNPISTSETTSITYHDPCHLGRELGVRVNCT